MPNVMAALPNIGGALCSTPQSLADAYCLSTVQKRCQDAKPVEMCWGASNSPTDLSRVGRSSPYCENMWGRHCCLTFFLSIVDTCLRREDIARQICAMVHRWRILFSASHAQHVSDLHPKISLRPHHVWKYGRHPICDGWDYARRKR